MKLRILWRAGVRGSVLCLCLLVTSGVVPAEVRVSVEKITIPTWEIGPPQVHPLFPDSGRHIYPYTLNETLTDRKVDKTYTGIFLENEYIRLLVLPEIGGRLHGALDKTNNYVWLYWQRTIKPGLISMTGAWISGGIEWNFPHGHRPSCFMPVDYRVVRHKDGSATVWVGETEPIFRMRWLVGMTVYPGRSYVRCDYVFINPTDHRHSFMFWATAATHANEHVQAQYPGDMVTGHGKHEFWNWPIHEGVDLTWWKNVPNASSFFAFNNPSEWFGTYDHKAQGGTVHYANVHVMPGKKLWTWGSGPSGRIWEDILSDGGGPYFEPQAGAWSDNQPDYHWMAPHEVKTAHDYWYPVRDIRGFHNANRDFAVNTDVRDGKAFAGVNATGVFREVKVVVKDTRSGATLSEAVATISPDKPYTVEVAAPAGLTVYDLRLSVFDAGGKPVIELQQRPPRKVELPEGQKDPGDPAKMNQDELYHAGEWLDRFRRTEEALNYYGEAIKRDPGDSRVNAELGYLALKQGRWREALDHIERALKRDSDNGRLHFGRGLAQLGLGNVEEAYSAFYRATYAYEYLAPGYLNLARIDMRRGDFRGAIEKLGQAQAHNERFADIEALKASAYRRLGRHDKALAAASRALELDPMHFMGGYERVLALRNTGQVERDWEAEWRSIMRDAAQNYLELAVAYGGAGLYRDAVAVLDGFARRKDDAALEPMVNYFRGYYTGLQGDAAGARRFYELAARGRPEYTLPHRMEAEAALRAALAENAGDANAHLFLGNLLYAKGRREEGLQLWRKAAKLKEQLWLAWRNIGYGERHLRQDLRAAREAYERAAALAPGDARILLEADEVASALGVPSGERLAYLEGRREAVSSRDDLTARLIDLQLEAGGEGYLRQAYETLKTRHFHSWEGRYGIHHAWVEVNQKLGDLAMARKDYETARRHFEQAADYPRNLEVAPRTPDFRAHVNWNLAKLYMAMNESEKAQEYLRQITAEEYTRPHLGTLYQALAWKAQGREDKYTELLKSLEAEARKRTSGRFEYRGAAETIGHYLLSLVLAERGQKQEAAEELKKALGRNPPVRRLAIREAQIDLARAHQ